MRTLVRPLALVPTAVVLALTLAAPVQAQHIIPGPSETGYDAALDAKAGAYDRQIHALGTVPLGWGLEAYVSDPAKRAIVESFLASGSYDFQATTGMHPYQVVDEYGEQGDLGMFGGVGAAGDAFRYMVVRDSGAPAADVDRARAHLVAALDGLHWYTAVTGRPGSTARGLWRAVPAPGDPPMPLPAITTVPVGTPPHGTEMWHADQSGTLPSLVWLDNTSHDQLDGYIFALGAAYDAVADDPSIDASLVTRLQDDARAIAHSLMTPVVLDARNTLDLVIVDADGLPTSFPDLNARMLGPTVLSRAINGWNAWMALGVIRTLYAITGDSDIGRYYYEELVGRRGYLDLAERNVGAMYTGVSTNYSNVNMAFVAAFGLLRYETDPTLAARARDILWSRLYSPGVDRQARGCQQSFFDLMVAGFRPRGVSDAEGAEARDDGLTRLAAFPMPPSWDTTVVNCDAAELASLACTASDGTPLPLSPLTGHGGNPEAIDPLPVRLRPPSNFLWRDDPHGVNGGGSSRLNPGMDWQGAYWMGRLLVSSTDGMGSVSSHARAPLPIPDGGVPDVDAGAADAGASSPTESGCGCTTVGVREPIGAGALAVAVVLVVAATRRRRARQSGGARPSGA